MNQPNYTMVQIALQIQKWLCDTIQTGKTYYVKSKDIGHVIGINPKTAGICLAFLSDEENHPFAIVKWGLSRSITWKITRKETWTEEDIRVYAVRLERDIKTAEKRTNETQNVLPDEITPLSKELFGGMRSIRVCKKSGLYKKTAEFSVNDRKTDAACAAPAGLDTCLQSDMYPLTGKRLPAKQTVFFGTEHNR